jgi:hypothetical protein
MRRTRNVPPVSPRTSVNEGLVEVNIVPHEHSAAPGLGFDLGVITLSDTALLERTMRYFGIDPTLPNSREQYSRTLRRLEVPRQRGQKSEDLQLVVWMASVGVTSGDSATVAARKVAEHYRYRGTGNSLTQKIRRLRRK